MLAQALRLLGLACLEEGDEVRQADHRDHWDLELLLHLCTRAPHAPVQALVRVRAAPVVCLWPLPCAAANHGGAGRQAAGDRLDASDGTCCIAESLVSPPPRSSLSSATTMPARVAPWAPMIAAASLAAVPAVITSSTMSARPASGAPTIVPPSPG